MKILTYFSFTLVSILMQFCVMDLIQERLRLNEDPVTVINVTSPKKQLSDVLKHINNKPHALYYQTKLKNVVNANNLPKNLVFSNTSLLDMSHTTTDISSTILDVFYDENVSLSEGSFTTENLFTSMEFDNVTEVSLFGNKNQTVLNSSKPKTIIFKDCFCNFLFHVCDINCCCDNDCSSADRILFNCLDNNNKKKVQNTEICYSHVLHNHYKHSSNIIDSLFCIVKVNLPEKRDITNDYKQTSVDQFFKWRSNNKPKITHLFTKEFYKSGDPIWILNNGSVYHADLPSVIINNYCSGRKPLRFFKDEKIYCSVKLGDLEMFNIIKTTEEAVVVSATNVSSNSSALNCSTLHCINWTVIVCDGLSCEPYSKRVHEPLCTDNICRNLALTADYIFYYYDNKIINATIKLHIQNVTIILPFMSQEINVKFLIANESIDNVLEFSGSPGYMTGLPVIVSIAESNYTASFYRHAVRKENYFSLGGNNYRNGLCLSANMSRNHIQFGLNKRMKCRYVHHYEVYNVDACKEIQGNMSNILFGLNINKIAISPLGNPQAVRDEDWILLNSDGFNEPVYGEIDIKASRLHCYNIFTKISFVFAFSNVNDIKEGNKILSANCNVSRRNITFNIEDISTVMTTDVNFIDVTKPGVFEYAGSPQLNVHLPKDFFYPYRSNESYVKYSNFNVILFCCIIFYMQIKQHFI